MHGFMCKVRLTAGLGIGLPIVMTVSALLAVVGNFKANTIWVREEGCPIVWGVLGVKLRFRSLDTKRTKLIGNRHNIGN